MAGKIPPQFLKHIKGAAKKMKKKGDKESAADTKSKTEEKDKKLPPWLQKKKAK